MKKTKKVILLGFILAIVGIVFILTTNKFPEKNLIINKENDYTQAYNHNPNNILENVFAEDNSRILPFIFDTNKQSIKKSFLEQEFEEADIIIKNKESLGEIIRTGDIIETESAPYIVLIYGDVNGDGLVDTFDAQCIIRHFAYGGQYELQGIYAKAGNVDNRDDEIDTFDAQRIIRFTVYETPLVFSEPVAEGVPEYNEKALSITNQTTKSSYECYEEFEIVSNIKGYNANNINLTWKVKDFDNNNVNDSKVELIDKTVKDNKTIVTKFIAKEKSIYTFTPVVEDFDGTVADKQDVFVTIKENGKIDKIVFEQGGSINIHANSSEMISSINIPATSSKIISIKFKHKYNYKNEIIYKDIDVNAQKCLEVLNVSGVTAEEIKINLIGRTDSNLEFIILDSSSLDKYVTHIQIVANTFHIDTRPNTYKLSFGNNIEGELTVNVEPEKMITVKITQDVNAETPEEINLYQGTSLDEVTIRQGDIVKEYDGKLYTILPIYLWSDNQKQKIYAEDLSEYMMSDSDIKVLDNNSETWNIISVQKLYSADGINFTQIIEGTSNYAEKEVNYIGIAIGDATKLNELKIVKIYNKLMKKMQNEINLKVNII